VNNFDIGEEVKSGGECASKICDDIPAISIGRPFDIIVVDTFMSAYIIYSGAEVLKI